MSFSAAHRHRGLALAAVAVAAVTSCSSPDATPIAAEPSRQADASDSAVPAVATPGPDAVVRTGLLTEATAEVDGGDRGVARSRAVVVDTSALPADAAQDVELPLFDDTTVIADLGAPTLRPEAGYRTWTGHIASDEGSTVVLVEQDGALSGTVASTDGTFRLRALSDGGTRVEQIDESQFPTEEELAVPPTEADTGGAVAGQPGDAPEIAEDPGDPVVDVLVAYTTAAETRNGGQAGMDADIALMIEQTNSAFSDSGVDASVRLVHTAEVALNSPVDGTTLGKLAGTSDGLYDELHVLRDQYGADLVALITDAPGGSACGIGYLLNNVSTSFAPYGVSLTDAGCATGNFSFTHELGHNFGASHDRGAWAGTAPVPYGYGWINPQQGWRTVMAYANACPGCTRLLRFSNPDLTYNGARMGAPAGASNAADNRAVLNLTASTIAGFRGAPVAASLTLTAPTAGQDVVASGKLVTTWSTSGYMGSDAKVELLRGSTVVKVLNAKVPLGTGRYEYVLPVSTVRADDYHLRVTPLLATQHAASSDAFSVVDPAITPSFAGTPAAGGTARVTWTYTGAPGGRVKVELLKDDKPLATLKTVALGTNGAGLADVTLPAALNDDAGYAFRTTMSAVPKAPALTGGFSVTSSRQLVVTSPGAGATPTAGAPMTVTWTASGDLGASVKAELVKGGLVVATSPLAPKGNGTLAFTPPAKLPSGDDYKVRLVAASFPMVIDTSDAFSLHGTSVTVTSQSTPSTITAGRPLTITFTTVGVPGTAVKLEAVHASLPPVAIATSVPLSAGTYTWNVPLTHKEGDWKVRATVVGNTLVTSTSAASTTVEWPDVSASVPAAGVAGAPVTVSWAFTDGAVAPVKVRLLQGTKAIATMTTSGRTDSDGTGSLTYRLPVKLLPGTYQVDVAAATNAAIADATADVAVTRPTLAASGATSVTRGQTATVSWTFSDGAAAPVRIELVQGTKVVLVKSGGVTTDAGTGSFVYKAPTTLVAGTYTLRIRPTLLATSTAVQATASFTVS